MFTTLDSAPLQVSANQTYRLRIEAIGTRLRGYVNDQMLVEATDKSMRTGRPGLITFGARADFDNVVVTPSPLQTIFVDDFQSQFISDSWRVAAGNWQHVLEPVPDTQTYAGSYVQTSNAVNAQVITGVSTDDQIIEADATSAALATGASFGVLARYAGSGNFYYLRMEPQNRIALWKSVNGSSFELASARLVRTPNVRNRLRLEALGDALRAYVDGKLVMEVRDQTHSTGRYGLATVRTAAEFDNVVATRP